MIARRTIVAILLVLTSSSVARADSKDEAISFNRDIRPILSDICFQCHGPDAKERKADLRLDSDEHLFAERDGHRMLVPGDPAKSELFRRLISTDDDERMPPPKSGKTLSAAQIATIRRWIEQGAKYQGHWAFLAPTRPRVPQISNLKLDISNFQFSISNPIDRFVLAWLNREGLSPSSPASKATLLRRVTLDLTGLPPTIDEIDEFLADESPDAFERVVDRLLASPRFGERFARPWLDAARYADTSGYQSDGERIMWRWRDWVIDAFNDNKPFDEFTVEQIAGDLLQQPLKVPNVDQILATGFNRNHRGNAEGGIIPEEYAVEYVVDRVDTTATVWLGLTLGCSRCHDHKFDPFSQREYYQLFAFFNNVPEKGRAIKFGNSPPFIATPTRDQQRQLEEFQRRLKQVSLPLQGDNPRQARQEWERHGIKEFEKEVELAKEPIDWTVSFSEVLRLPFDHDGKPAALSNQQLTNSRPQPQPLGPNSGSPTINAADRVPIVFGDGRIGKAAVFDGQRRLAVGDVANIGFFDKFTISAWIYAEAESGTILSRMSDDANSDGYNLCLENGKLQLNLIKRWLDDALRLETEKPIPLNEWVHVAVTCDGSRFASGVNLFVNGSEVPKRILLDELNQAFASKDLFRIGYGGLTPPFRGRIDEVRLFDRRLSFNEIAALSVPETITQILQQKEKRTPAQRFKLGNYFWAERAPPDIREATRQATILNREIEQLSESFPTTMVMFDLPQPRTTHVLIRGAYDRPGDRVFPEFPKVLPVARTKAPNIPEPLKTDPLNRLDLAQWLVSRGNPLTARVAVNRFWMQLFGQGLVKTVDDFGSQGDWPSHPELLDWLAVEFAGRISKVGHPSLRGKVPIVDHEIPTAMTANIKRLIRELVTSATYRQSSQASAELQSRDPDNRLLARGPRSRLSAEMVRDQALAASGLLTEQLGGPSIKPYQPEGLWDDLQSTEKYVQDHGPALYRRGLYVFWKRTIAPPVMVTFDAAGRETCIVRETRTNTPLQALTLLNEESFVEAARQLAERTLTSGHADVDRRARFAFRAVLTREPTDRELAVLKRGVERHLAHYQKHRDEAVAVLQTGESLADASLDPVEVAAWTAACGLILNLDEAVTKE